MNDRFMSNFGKVMLVVGVLVLICVGVLLSLEAIPNGYLGGMLFIGLVLALSGSHFKNHNMSDKDTDSRFMSNFGKIRLVAGVLTLVCVGVLLSLDAIPNEQLDGIFFIGVALTFSGSHFKNRNKINE